MQPLLKALPTLYVVNYRENWYNDSWDCLGGQEILVMGPWYPKDTINQTQPTLDQLGTDQHFHAVSLICGYYYFQQ